MKVARQIGLLVASAVLGISLAAAPAPNAHAGDSSWGCGGSCRPDVP
ncbi:hypothetical protein [Nocardioides sp. GXZ039]